MQGVARSSELRMTGVMLAIQYKAIQENGLRGHCDGLHWISSDVSLLSQACLLRLCLK